MEKEKSNSEKHYAYESRRKTKEQVLVDKFRKELKEEIFDEGLVLLAVYIFFMDGDL